jgi:hypothetical protein
MTHTYRAARANTILQIASQHLEGDDEDVVALPLHVPRPLTFVRFEMDDVDAIMRFAKPLYADRDKLIWAIQQGVRVLWKGANGISWINLELEDQATYSFFNETFKVGDLEYDNPVSLSDLGIERRAPGKENDQNDIDLAVLAKAVTEAVDADRVDGLSDELEKKVQDAVDRANWEVDAAASWYYETDETYAIFKDWEFDGPDGGEFEPAGFDNGILTLTRQITVSVEVHCSFEFSNKDGIDKDMVYIGSSDATRDFDVSVSAEFGFSGVAKGEPSLEWIEIARIAERVDFGYVEPDYDDEFDRGDDDEA